MRIIVIIALVLLTEPLFGQLYINTAAVVETGPASVVKVQSMDLENQGNIGHAGDLEVDSNIINSGIWICDPVVVSRIALLGNWSNNLAFNPGIGRVEFNGGNQSIGGTVPTDFYTLLLNGVSGNVKTMFNHVACLDSLYLTDVELATNGNIFTLRNAGKQVQRNSGYISTFSTGMVKTIYPSALSGNTELPLGYGLGVARYKPVYLINPTQDSFSFTLFGNSPTADTRNALSLQDSLCSINDLYYYSIITYDSPLFYGITKSKAELEYTKLGRWNGTQWDKITASGPTNSFVLPNLALNAQQPQLTEYISQASEMPFVDAGPDITLKQNESVQLNTFGYFPQGSTFLWTSDPLTNVFDMSCSDCPNPKFTMGSPGMYVVKVSNGSCEDLDTLLIASNIDYENLISNAFTPTDDKLNETFGPHLLPGDQLENLQIYNRWGEMIYEGTENWNGYYQGQLVMQGVYVYQMTIVGSSTGFVKRYNISGEVTVLR